MPRILPEIPYTCYVCGTHFTISNAGVDPFNSESRAAMQKPAVCPCCTAPEKHRGQLTPSNAYGLVQAYYGDSFTHEHYGDADTFLESLVLTPDDVATLMGQVERLDYAAWPESLRADAATDREAREVLAIAERAKRDMENGALLPKLHELAARVTAKLEQQRTTYLARYNERCGAGQKPPAVVYRVPQTNQQKPETRKAKKN